MKKCKECKREKLLSEFGKYWHNQARKFYFRSVCRSCCARYQLIWKSQNRNKQNRYCEKWVRKNQKKHKAHYTLNNAIISGKVKPMPCEICGKKAEGHHSNYNKPLFVKWLCPLHHKQKHKEELAIRRRKN